MSSSLSLWSLWLPRVAVVEATGNLQPHRWFVLETDLGILGTHVGGKAKGTSETMWREESPRDNTWRTTSH